MRDLLEKALNKGLTVCFTSENGFDVIRICCKLQSWVE